MTEWNNEPNYLPIDETSQMNVPMDELKDVVEQGRNLTPVENQLIKTQAKVDEWEAARDAAPTNETMGSLEYQMNQAKEAAERAEAEYRRAAVQKACVYGWQVIANDLGISAKMLHNWHKEYAPEMKDLSMVPEKEKDRLDKMKVKMEAKARQFEEQMARAEEFRQRRAARLAALDEALNAAN